MPTGPTNVAGRRTIGFVLESVLDVVVVYAVIALAGIELAVAPTGQVYPADRDQLSRLALVVPVIVAYWFGTKVVTLWLKGWTPCMLFMELRCVRYDGRPPSLVRALVRSAFFWGMLNLFGCLFWLVMFASVLATRTGRLLQDGVADTFVIDKASFGRLISVTPTGTAAGPMSMTREEAARIAQREGVPFEPPTDTRHLDGKPFFDKRLQTHVVWSRKEGCWRAFDPATGEWRRID